MSNSCKSSFTIYLLLVYLRMCQVYKMNPRAPGNLLHRVRRKSGLKDRAAWLEKEKIFPRDFCILSFYLRKLETIIFLPQDQMRKRLLF